MENKKEDPDEGSKSLIAMGDDIAVHAQRAIAAAVRLQGHLEGQDWLPLDYDDPCWSDWSTWPKGDEFLAKTISVPKPGPYDDVINIEIHEACGKFMGLGVFGCVCKEASHPPPGPSSSEEPVDREEQTAGVEARSNQDCPDTPPKPDKPSGAGADLEDEDSDNDSISREWSWLDEELNKPNLRSMYDEATLKWIDETRNLHNKRVAKEKVKKDDTRPP